MEAFTLSDFVETKNQSPQTKLRIIHASRSGVSRSDLKKFSLRVALPLTKISEVVPASYSTLSKKSNYDKEVSERLFEIAEVYAKGFEVFGDEKKFNNWIHEANLALGGIPPFSLLDTSYGVQIVLNELGRIDHGIFA
ncbi:antitoxin Xre/MbcA/ParS toxin-binding domain-containing protein [Sungkyunkwania multivorans]|uniref:Antitoxin Xre/MbcA/ParS toxin-binding domain-containing protein n=1 Tax=Sungkyunkwania multivorans TaxID=1173618 RepID=A0ABW3D1D8_9FLAO